MKRATRENRCNNANTKKKLTLWQGHFIRLKILHCQIHQISGQDEKKKEEEDEGNE